MISKLIIASFVALVACQTPEQYPAGVDPAKCPNFPICDNAFLHNSQAVPRTLSYEHSGVPQGQHPQQHHHYQQQEQKYQQQPQQHQKHVLQDQRVSVPVSHRNTALPSHVHSAPALAPFHHYQTAPTHSNQYSSNPSQWTLKNIRFDGEDFYQNPTSNHLSEPPVHATANQQRYYEPEPQQPQYNQQEHQQQQHYAQESHRNYSPESAPAQQHKGSQAADGYPADVDARSCPNYPFCDVNGAPSNQAPAQVHAPASPLPGFPERLYPAGVSPEQCANFPYCFE